LKKEPRESIRLGESDFTSLHNAQGNSPQIEPEGEFSNIIVENKANQAESVCLFWVFNIKCVR